MIDSMGGDGEFCGMVSKHTGAIVLDCDYVKGTSIATSYPKCVLMFLLYLTYPAPEHPFPAAYEDVCDVVAYVLVNENGRYDTSRLTIGGFSAGGTLSLVVGATMPQGTFKGQL